MVSSDSKNPNPPVTDAIRDEVERQLGVKLPDSYVNLMREHNGGYVNEQLVRYEGDIPAGMEYYIGDGYIPVDSIAGMNPEPDVFGSVTHTPYLTKEWDLPAGLVLLDGDGHTWVALDYRQAQNDPPVIYIVSDGGQYITIAENFSAFLEKLVPYERIYDEEGNLK